MIKFYLQKRYAILAFALLLAGCANQPYTPAPPNNLPSVAPVATGNTKIKAGNAAIATGNKAIQGQLDEARASLDQAITEAQDQKEQNAKLDKSLASARQSLAEAIKEAVAQDDRIKQQDATIDEQAQRIATLTTQQNDAQAQVNTQTGQLNDARQEVANLQAFEDKMKAYWGFGAILWGIGRLGWHILIILVILAAISFAINFFIPAARPFFQAVIAFFKKLNPFKKPPS